jgi:hypothetical protein
MAIRITRIDDVDGTDGAEAVVFELDHRTYEIDLCVRNKLRFLRAIAPFVDRARLIEESGDASAAPRTVRHTSRRQISTSVNEDARGLDLIEMARQVEG